MDMIRNLGGKDHTKLLQGFALLLSVLEQASKLTQGIVSPKNRQRGQDSFQFDQGVDRESGLDADAMGAFSENYFDSIQDSFARYEEKQLNDGKLLRRYENGCVRVINPHSNVIQEESPVGHLTVSLPDGRILFQEHPGNPLLLYDTATSNRPRLARVAMVSIGGQAAFPAYTFSDEEKTHVIDIESLRYFQVARQATQSSPMAPQQNLQSVEVPAMAWQGAA